jgi:hypothetical protein
MHDACAPPAHAQQSAFCAHFSYSCEQPVGVLTHEKASPPSAPLVARQ